jgi:cation diffusion facilitator family transporter
VVKIFVRLSGKPADSEHPYGHHQLESIAALVVSAFVITTSAAIFWDSVNSAFDLLMGTTPQLKVRVFALVVAVATIISKIFLMLHASRISKKTQNLAISALARDHRNDIFASTGAVIGIVLNMLGFALGDPIAGAIVAVIVAKTGLDILREASSDLMDNVPSKEISAQIHELLNGEEEIKSIEDIHAHRFGPYLVVNLTIGIDGDLSVKDGDKIADTVERMLISGIEMLRKVYVHYHPFRTKDLEN